MGTTLAQQLHGGHVAFRLGVLLGVEWRIRIFIAGVRGVLEDYFILGVLTRLLRGTGEERE
jgi:hypothetical protein